MQDLKVRFHWLAVTFFLRYDDFTDLIWEGWIKDTFGDLVESNHGGRGYRSLYNALLGVQVYKDPINKDCGENVHLVIPGQACDAIVPDNIIKLFRWISGSGIKVNITRFDVAIDGGQFTPLDFYHAILEGRAVSLVKRHTLTYYEQPFQAQDDIEEEGVKVEGSIGCHTCYIGSRQSERLIRVYDARGFTRLEFQTSGARCNLVAHHLLTSDYIEWLKIAFFHIRQYIDIDCTWWKEFTEGSVRGDIKISSARVTAANNLNKWLKQQVSAVYYVMQTLSGDIYHQELQELGKERIKHMRLKGSCRYDALLQLVGV